jgi:hypothetical protein
MTAEKKLGIGSVVSGGSGSGSSGKPWCTASASWSAEYCDYDVYVHSNQRDDTKATATASNGASNYWWTDFKVTVGSASCSTTT